MKRREFIKLLSAVGISAPLGLTWLQRAEAATVDYGGPLLLFIHANGGWDAPSFCDPKGGLGRGFVTDEIEQAGGIRYAPLSWTDPVTGTTHAFATDLFSNLHGRMIVVNGINMQTNAHLAGYSNTYQGSFSTAYPTLSAALTAARAPDLLVGYLVTGVHYSTGGLVPFTRIGSGTALREIATPNKGYLPNRLSGQRMPDEVFSVIENARLERLQATLDDTSLTPRRRRMLNAFLNASAQSSGMDRLANVLPSDGFQYDDERAVSNELVRQADVALHAMAGGVCAGADLQLLQGNFDSHANHAPQQREQFANVAYAVRFIWNRAEEIDARTGSNISSRLNLVIHSEFGRAPHFNSDDGTDHWPTTSAIIMNKAFETNGMGGRTVGWSTNDGRYWPGKINTTTLEPDEGGVELTSAHLHKALRRYLGIEGAPVLSPFGFPGVEDVNMFAPGLATEQG